MDSKFKLTLAQQQQFEQLTSSGRTTFIFLSAGAALALLGLAWIEGRFSHK